MQQYFNRREFLNTLLLAAAAPSLLTPNQHNSTLQNPSTLSPQVLAKISPVDDQFISVNGWVLPAKTLTRGGG